jgi:hypothetical protein
MDPEDLKKFKEEYKDKSDGGTSGLLKKSLAQQ